MPPEAVDLVSRLLQYSPNLRCTIAKARTSLVLHPESTSIAKHRDEVAAQVQRHDLVSRADEPSADKHGWNGRAAAEEPPQRLLHLLPPWVLVELDHRRVHPELAEEACHGVAHAAGAHAEDHHRTLRCEPRHPVHLAGWSSSPRARRFPVKKLQSLVALKFFSCEAVSCACLL